MRGNAGVFGRALAVNQSLRLDGHALGGTPREDHRPGYALFSIGLHAAVLAALILVPLLGEIPAPEPALGVRAFFVDPGILAAPPPPPPPPAAAPRAAAVKAPPSPTNEVRAFVAPTEIADKIAHPSLSVAEGGVLGGVEGGVEGGVAGGIVGGLPMEMAPSKPQAQVVRVGGDIRAPKRLAYVPPVYPLIASQAGLFGIVIIEARVGTDGWVKETMVLRSQPVFDEAAQAAVMQWRYQPLLLNGVPMEFLLTVTVKFSVRGPE